MTIGKFAQLIKRESSHWANHSGILITKFQWQYDYIAISVSPSNLERVRKYIYKEEHYKRMTWKEEYDYFLKCEGIIKIENNTK